MGNAFSSTVATKQEKPRLIPFERQGVFLFLDLPPELRLQVYQYLDVPDMLIYRPGNTSPRASWGKLRYMDCYNELNIWLYEVQALVKRCPDKFPPLPHQALSRFQSTLAWVKASLVGNQLSVKDGQDSTTVIADLPCFNTILDLKDLPAAVGDQDGDLKDYLKVVELTKSAAANPGNDLETNARFERCWEKGEKILSETKRIHVMRMIFQKMYLINQQIHNEWRRHVFESVTFAFDLDQGHPNSFGLRGWEKIEWSAIRYCHFVCVSSARCLPLALLQFTELLKEHLNGTVT